jgi:hypothetical protein
MSNAISDSAKNTMLTAFGGAYGFVSLHTGDPSTTGANEATGGSPAYARKAITWSAASAGSMAASNAPVFDVPAGTYYYLGFWTLSSGGTWGGYVPLGSTARRACAVTAADLAGNTIQSPAHGYVAGNQVVFWSTIGASVPTGLSEGTVYFVIATGLTTDVFEVSTTLGGAAVDITAIGDADVQKLTSETFAAQGTYTATTTTISLPG